MNEFNKRLTEINEILKYIDRDDYSKIPKDFLNLIETNMDKNHIWKYDTSKTLEEQNLPDDTIAILSFINLEYLVNEEQKEFLIDIYRENESKAIDTNHKIESVKELFKNSEKENNFKQRNEIIKENKKSIFTKILEKIKNIFK